ncbi:MAG: PstC family ABC transporter permease, partial [Eubacteriales bacterium]
MMKHHPGNNRHGADLHRLRFSRLFEDAVHTLFLLCGLVTVGCVLILTVYLTAAGIPAIREIGLISFLFGTEWAPTSAEPSYGILPFLLTSIWGTAGAVVIGVPVGFFSAVWLSKCAPKKVRAAADVVIGVLAGIPSVVYGL